MIIDTIACLLVAFGFYQGFTKGLIKTVFSTLSILIAVVATFKLSGNVIDFIQASVSIHPGIAFVLGFVLTFIVVMALIRFIGNKLEKLVNTIHIGFVNKILGGFVLGLFYAILVSYAVYFTQKVELISPQQKEASFTYPMLEPLPRLTASIGSQMKPYFQEFWDALLVTMDSLKEKTDEIQIQENN